MFEKEAEENYTKTDKEFMGCQDEGEIFNLAYLASAKPREKRIAELEAQIEKMKQALDSARENANKQEQWNIYSVLNDIYNNNYKVITSVSN